MIIDFFASLSFYLVPYLTGRFFTKKIVPAWIMGSLFWFIFYFLLIGIFSFGNLGSFSQIVRFSIIVVSLISLVRITALRLKKGVKIEFTRLLIPVFLAIFTTVIYFLIWKRNTPYPLQLNWDIYEHITLANLISQGNLSFVTSKISDTFTFNSYSPFFEILLSIPKILFQKSLLGIYWWLEYWHYLATVLASYLLAKEIFPNKWLATISALISALVFESLVVYSSLFLIPQTLVGLMTILVFKDIKNHKPWFLLIAGVSVFLMHYVVGSLSLVILLLGFLVSRYKFIQKHINLAVIFSLLFSGILISINFLGKWFILGIEEAAHFNFSIWEKLGYLSDWYGAGSLILVLIGCVLIVKNGNAFQKLVLILAFLIFGISFAPFSYFLKFYVLGRYFVNLIIAVSLWIIISRQRNLFRVAAISMMILISTIVFYKNQVAYKEPLHSGTLETQISFEEIQAANWLILHKGDNQFLVSDPSSQYIFEAISEVNTQGGVYMNLSSRNALISINKLNDPVLIKSKLLRVKDDLLKKQNYPGKTLFVIGGRYFAWQDLPEKQKQSSFYNVWSPRLITSDDQSRIDFLAKSKQFKLIYKNSEVAIFEII